MNKFKPGEYAFLEGRIVEIIEVLKPSSKYWPDDFFYKIKLLDDTLTHKVHEKRLLKTDNQTAPKVLFSSR